MSTPILDITELASGQIDQFATANEAFRALEAAANDFSTVDFSSGDVTLTNEEFFAALLFRSDGNTVARTLTTPAQRRLFVVHNDGTATLTVECGATTVDLDLDAITIFYTDGTANGLFPIASGSGGGVTGFTSSLNTSAPNATVNIAQLLANTASSTGGIALTPKSNGPLMASLPDGTSTGGNVRGTGAVDFQTSRSSASAVASGDRAFIGGGSGNEASGNYSVVAGGISNTASALRSAVVGGNSNDATADYSVVVGGYTNVADGEFSWVPGGRYATTKGLHGAAACASGRFLNNGDAQRRRVLLMIETADDTATAATADEGAQSTDNQLILDNNSTYLFTARVVARSSADSAAYEIQGLMTRAGTAGSTALEGSLTKSVIAESGGATAWDVTASTDTTNGGIEIIVTGAAATNIKWLADVQTVEIYG